ncbi:phage/plasmid primase, P4 family [Propionimicrobium sp. PCR01-08-3]|uniref:DNA primase family protein n=1 Tax=Propionimicrobium sp. PCR01-08-3 TaxID=3052086 RepID=UPI00255C9C8A|nr:phage/plasmid primase, P4 family [Propionimicrobium sp. PCR01-08-3]WIY83943.1 phage/plasmid primase, P4 family [Propionimicrobium sp. PCR01-08-3]
MTARESRPTLVDEAASEAFGGADIKDTTGALGAEDLDAAVERLRRDEAVHRKHIRVAHAFAAGQIRKFIHVTGLGWFRWDGRRWAEDLGDKRASAAVMDVIREMWLKGGARDLSSDLGTCSTASGVKGVLALAAALPGITVAPDEMDADPYLLNVANGTLDLHTLQLRPHDPRDRISKVARASYNPGATSEVWTAFLERVLPDEEVRDYLGRFFGLGLVGKTLEHIFTIATGSGRNGKGVCYGAVMHALGDYAGVADPALMEVVKSNPNSPSPAFFDLRGRRLVVLSETDTKIRLSASVLKRLTGGDAIKARALHKDPIQFNPSHQFLMVTNHLPELPSKEADPAVWARIRVVPFDEVIPKHEQDPRLPEKLELAADAILTWMVAGLGDYWEQGLNEPDAVSSRTDEYAQAQDDVRRWVEEECTEVDDYGLGDTTKRLHDAYQEWCAAEGMYKRDILGRGMFGQALDAMGFEATKQRRGMVRLLALQVEGAPPPGQMDEAAAKVISQEPVAAAAAEASNPGIVL